MLFKKKEIEFIPGTVIDRKPPAVEADLRLWHEKGKDGKAATGRTIAIIRHPNYIAVGISRCSKNDQFQKRIGRNIASGRAQKVAAEFLGLEDQSQAIIQHGSVEGEIMSFVVSRDVTNIPRGLLKRMKIIPQWLIEDRRE